MRVNARQGPTSRQREVWRLVALGYSYTEVATQLGIAQHTVTNHLVHLRTELAVTNQIEVALAAWQHGIITEADRDTRLAELRECLTSIGEY